MSSLGHARALTALLAWLGPWTPASAVPRGVRRSLWTVRQGNVRGPRGEGVARLSGAPDRLDAYVYRPARPRAAYMVAPGLHFAGPDDPRLDRFCRILASAGYLVVAPFIPAYTDLRVEPEVPDDLELVVRALLERLPSGWRPTLFSISFGSWPALEVAARLGSEIDSVVTFGGYAEFEAAVRFCVDGVLRDPAGDQQLQRDPLNSPALFVNLLPFLEYGLDDPAPLEAAWLEMAHRTWGKMDLKQPGRRDPFAHAIAARLAPELREPFLVGCGLREGTVEQVVSALERGREHFAFCDPGSALQRVRCPVVIAHGRDDDVIPWNEACKLHDRLAGRVPVQLLLTGLYGHTGTALPSPGELVREVRSLLYIAKTLASAGEMLERRPGLLRH